MRPPTTRTLTERDVVVYRINGPFFFGAASIGTMFFAASEPAGAAWCSISRRCRCRFDGRCRAEKGVIADFQKRGVEVVLTVMSRPVRRS